MFRSLIVGATGSLGFAIARQRAKFGERVVLRRASARQKANPLDELTGVS